MWLIKLSFEIFSAFFIVIKEGCYVGMCIFADGKREADACCLRFPLLIVGTEGKRARDSDSVL